MFNLHNKLTADFTLFTLNDSKTTKFYIKNIKYFIKYFPFLKDIELVTKYFVAGNIKFSQKFKKHIPSFLKIIEYLESNENKEIIDLKNISKQVSYLYPSDEESHTDEEKLILSEEQENSYSEDVSSWNYDNEKLDSHNVFDSMSALSLTSSSSQNATSLIKIPENTNFTINPVKIVIYFFCQVVNHYIGSFTINTRFVKSMVNKLEYDHINDLLMNLVREGLVLPILIKNNWIPEIITKRIKTLSAIVDSLMSSNKNNIEDEEEFIYQIGFYQDQLVNRYFEIGKLIGYLDTNDNEFINQTIEEEDSLNLKDSNLDPSHSVLISNVRKIKIDISDMSDISESEISSFHGTSKKINFENISEEDIRQNPLKYGMEASIIYKILHAICLNRNKMNIRVVKVKVINKFTLEYLRLLSYNPSIKNNKIIENLITMFFTYKDNTHLQISIIRIFVKVNPSILKSLGFFEQMYNVSYTYISKIKGEVNENENPSVVDGLFSFIIRLYMRFATFIKSEYPDWLELHDLMKPFCQLETIKYLEKDLNVLVEYDGFERYVIENMLSSIPYPSIFEENKLNQ